MKLQLYFSPLEQPVAEGELLAPASIMAMLADVEADDWFPACGSVLLDGRRVGPETWDCVLSPGDGVVLEFICVPQGKKTLVAIATVAVTALGVAVSGGLLGPAGLGLLGASFASGGIGAALAGAGIGLAGSLAISALSGPPKLGNQGAAVAGEQRVLNQAGVSGNQLTLLDVLPVVLGKIGYSPPILAPAYSVLSGDDVTTHVIVGVEGRCAISNIRVNDVAAASFPDLAIEQVEETSAATVFGNYPRLVIEERPGVQLSNFKTELETTNSDYLVDQLAPANSIPDYHTFETAGAWDELVLRFLFPAGLVKSDTAAVAAMPMRVELRRKGDVAWRNLPTFYFADRRKGAGAMRAEIRLQRSLPPSGQMLTNAKAEYPIFEVTNSSARGSAFQYDADAYFGTASLPVDILPDMTAQTTAGVTITATPAGGTPWFVGDNNNTNGWGVTAAAPYMLRIDFSAPTPFRSFRILSTSDASSPVQTHLPKKFHWEGLDGAAWVRLDAQDHETKVLTKSYVGAVAPSLAYTSYRLVVDETWSGTAVQIYELELFAEAGLGTSYNTQTNGRTGDLCVHADGTIRCRYVKLVEEGAVVYLDPAQWPAGEYEVRVRRGVAFAEASFADADHTYGTLANSDFFEYRTISGKLGVYVGQKNYRSDCALEVMQTAENVPPIIQAGLSAMALSVKNAVVNSIYAEFTRYAPVWDGEVWAENEVMTSNPAALYRQILLGGGNQKPLPGETVDEAGLAAWFETCNAQTHECNAVLQGARIAEALQMLASTGYAAPQSGELYGVVEDRDTTTEPVRFAVSPLNSRAQGDSIPQPDLPDAIRAEFSNAAQKYAVDHLLVYREGVAPDAAKVFDTINYGGFTDAAKVAARAGFDLKQSILRQRRYYRALGLQGILIRRGDLVQLLDDVVDYAVVSGWISQVTRVGDDVVSVTLDNVMPWSSGQNDIEALQDVETLADVEAVTQAMGLIIQRGSGETAIQAQVSNVVDGNSCVFAVPINDPMGTITTGLLAGAGPWGQIGRRCKVMSIQPQGFETRILELADEAPELYA